MKNGPFYQIIQDHYTFDGSPFLIHGKIDSPAFFADINDWIKNIVESKIYYKEGSTVPRSIDNEIYIIEVFKDGKTRKCYSKNNEGLGGHDSWAD